MNTNKGRRLLWITLFAIAMGLLESSVVIYLREILYPTGFNFPLAPISSHLAFVEFSRELATLVMLISIGIIAGRTKLERFVLFLYSFAVWDIFYYIFLKLIINWPGSLFTWDILFLIPITWTGPVLAPVISSVTMIVLTFVVTHMINHEKKININLSWWVLLITGASLQFLSFVLDYSRFILSHYSVAQLWSIQGKNGLYSLSLQYIPKSFPWGIFIAGILAIMVSIIILYSHNSKKQ